MTFLLLTGAGFSHNWGGWLGAEAFEYLLGSNELDDALRRELWSDKNQGQNFEYTLGRLQQNAKTDATGRIADQVNKLTSALVGMFNLMDQGLKAQTFEFQNDRAFQIGPFLTRFDALFTLNQDLFLERKYAHGISLLGPRRWNGFASPGVGAPKPTPYYDPDLAISADRSPVADANYRMDSQIQPYFKLHGSSNWYDERGARMLVMGGNKSVAIGTSPLLKWYADQFDQHMKRPDTRLMVIGYGFGDPHINAAIIEGCRHGLKVFIIDREGPDVLDKRTGAIRPVQDDLMAAIQPSLIGASRRPLNATFGNDFVEYNKVIRFFER